MSAPEEAFDFGLKLRLNVVIFPSVLSQRGCRTKTCNEDVPLRMQQRH